MQVTIDRIEEGFAVVELPDMSTIIVPAELFPEAHEGDIYNITKDIGEMQARQERIEALRASLFED